MLGADARETQLDIPGKSSGSSDDVPQNSRDLRAGQFVMGISTSMSGTIV
jgi:hypothetical protein